MVAVVPSSVAVPHDTAARAAPAPTSSLLPDVDAAAVWPATWVMRADRAVTEVVRSAGTNMAMVNLLARVDERGLAGGGGYAADTLTTSARRSDRAGINANAAESRTTLCVATDVDETVQSSPPVAG